MAKKACGCFDKCGIPIVASIVIGIGLGALLTYPIFGTHPVRWGIALIVIGAIGLFYPSLQKNS